MHVQWFKLLTYWEECPYRAVEISPSIYCQKTKFVARLVAHFFQPKKLQMFILKCIHTFMVIKSNIMTYDYCFVSISNTANSLCPIGTRLTLQRHCESVCVCVQFFTSLLDATARWRGVSHILSLALTRAPAEKEIVLFHSTVTDYTKTLTCNLHQSTKQFFLRNTRPNREVPVSFGMITIRILKCG